MQQSFYRNVIAEQRLELQELLDRNFQGLREFPEE